ncbi:STAS domain-containing protein [Actinoplanes sp. NPDC048967]|uniref:STAS domain-containing protein n=1 Tax=Actinoplanes sp. NPDC048967 TaxID=3155269 RepID=UPI0033C6D2AC
MRITTHLVNDGVIRLAVHGELDLGTADRLTDTVDEVLAAARPAEVVLDLAGLSLCDSVGVDALLRARAAANAQAVHLTVINPRGIVRRVLDLTGTLDRLTGVPALI